MTPTKKLNRSNCYVWMAIVTDQAFQISHLPGLLPAQMICDKSCKFPIILRSKYLKTTE